MQQLPLQADGQWVKWVKLPPAQSAGADRSEGKLFACPNWNHKERYDIVQLANGSYFALWGLYEGPFGIVGVGQIAHHCPEFVRNYRMPVVRCVSNAPLVAKMLDLNTLHPAIVVAHPNRTYHEEMETTMLNPPYSPLDVFYHHLTLTTYGRGRYHDTTSFLPANNGHHTWLNVRLRAHLLCFPTTNLNQQIGMKV